MINLKFQKIYFGSTWVRRWTPQIQTPKLSHRCKRCPGIKALRQLLV